MSFIENSYKIVKVSLLVLVKMACRIMHSKPEDIMFKNFTGDANLNNCCKMINNFNAAQAKM